jgi:hypothetical protein
MTATEQRTTGLFPHQNGRTSPSTVSCVSSNVGSITDFLFASSHSTSTNIPSNEIQEKSSSPPPQILIHTSSEQCIDNTEQPININQLSVRNFIWIMYQRKRFVFFLQIKTSENDNEPLSAVNREKLGHRRVDEAGTVTYKRVMVDDLMKSLQIGLNYNLGKHHHPQRQVLLQDFQQIEYQDFPPLVFLWFLCRN